MSKPFSTLQGGDNIAEYIEREALKGKKILDATCGAKTMWFDKNNDLAVFFDKRQEHFEQIWKNAGNCKLDISPDVIGDFTDLPFPDNSFALVVFDPPHLTSAKETSWLVKKYSKLDENWPQMLRDGFRECMRVLKPDGVLIFKWSEHDIAAVKVWEAIGERPLFGHKSGKQSKTFWGCFMKTTPAADVAEIKHGEWIVTRYHLYLNVYEEFLCCSVCGYEHQHDERFEYCPHCGAKMDGATE